MPPKKEDKKKGTAPQLAGATQTITEEELNEAKNLPQIKDFIFFNMFAFKQPKNQERLKAAIKKQFQFLNPEDPEFTEELAQTYRTIDQTQLLTQAQARGLLTEQEATEISKMEIERKRKILAQATLESVTAYQLHKRQKLKEAEAAQDAPVEAAIKGRDTPMSQPLSDDASVHSAGQKVYKYDQVLLLSDFPQTPEDVQALLDVGFDKLHGGFLVEETFNRDIDDEEDDDTKISMLGGSQTDINPQLTSGSLDELKGDSKIEGSEPAATDPNDTSALKPSSQNTTYKLTHRAMVFENAIQINRMLKQQPIKAECRNIIMERLKFEGPQNPFEGQILVEEGAEPPSEEEQQKQNSQMKKFEEFAKDFKTILKQIAVDLQQYRDEKSHAEASARPLWPVFTEQEEEQLKRSTMEEERQSQLDLQAAAEEEKKAAEAATKGGKKSQQKAREKTVMSNASKEGELAASPDPGEDQKTVGMTDKKSLQPKFKSHDEDPSKNFEFTEFDKIMLDIQTGQTSVGSILGAMLFQINSNVEARHKAALDAENPQRKMVKKLSSKMLKKQSTMQLQQEREDEAEMCEVFDTTFTKLKKQHAVLETNYKHQFGDIFSHKESPYMIVKSDNDKMQLNKDHGAFSFLSGAPQDSLERQVLEECLLPGVNKRQGMPEKSALRQATRESNQDQIINYCQLPPSMTKRALILKGFEDMMNKYLRDRGFNFLDRNYIEEYKDPDTVRQILMKAMTHHRPDVLTEYFEMDDGLLVSIFYKNPPGRLLRRQWSQPVRVLPDFFEWKQFVKDQDLKVDSSRLLDLPADKAGVMRVNTKFCFPSDNSVIRVDKYNVGQRIMGESQIFKDNLIFGITEKQEIFSTKVSNEDKLRNRDAKQLQDKRCDFWLTFDNGVRLTIEMQDSVSANMDQIPPSELPTWLKMKIEEEAKRRELEEASEPGRASVQDSIKKGANLDQIDLASGRGDSAAGSQMGSEDGGANAAVDSAMHQTKQSNNNSILKSEKKDMGASMSMIDKDPTEKMTHQDSAKPGGAAERVSIIEEEDEEWSNPYILINGVDMTTGAKLTFTFNEGLVVQLLPNGDCLQQCIKSKTPPKAASKGNSLIYDQKNDSEIESRRVITTNGEVIRYMADGNFIIYYSDGTITSTDMRKGIWTTTNSKGVRRVRKTKGRIISDEMTKLKIETKVDPETNAVLEIREDKVLSIKYIDQTQLLVMPDGTNILRKNREGGEAGHVTYITKQNYVPIRQTYDPVKARAKTIIGLGGTDALMGKDYIMERSNNGKISELLLPDETVVQTYLEKQELTGYNNFSSQMIHIIRRQDFSVVKVRQDGEVVLISANERAYLNDIGKQVEEFGTKDFDYFFELFGIPNERRSGVYTANLDKGRIWTEDEEGNYFIVYSNGDSVEKMSVSFNLDQMVEGIENKEPSSPRIKDGEFIEDECKFLPPPKSMADPRLIYIRNDGSGVEFFNEKQLRHMFRTFQKQHDDLHAAAIKSNLNNLIMKSDQTKINNEEVISHNFIQKTLKEFNSEGFNVAKEFPKLPQNLELVNQTVSIPNEPVMEQYTIKNVLEFKFMDQTMQREFMKALEMYQKLREDQARTKESLKFRAPKVITEAAAPQSDRMAMSEMRHSIMLGSQMSPKSDDFGKSSSMTGNQMNTSMGSQGNKQSPRLTRAMTKALMENQKKMAEEAAIKAAEEAQQRIMMEQDDLQFDQDTGQQVYKNELEARLSFMQKLQLRIAKERNINIQSLRGDEFKILKDFKKLEERKDLLNNMHDFFDSRFDMQTNQSSSILRQAFNNASNLSSQDEHPNRGRITSNLQGGDSRQQVTDENPGQNSMDSMKDMQKQGFNLLTSS